jgi:hypothetical protein
MIPKVSQEVLAEMVGTTRPRINEFMNKFRNLGFIEYNGALHIHSFFHCAAGALPMQEDVGRRQLVADRQEAPGVSRDAPGRVGLASE